MMKTLELKIPPVIQLILLGLLMWSSTYLFPNLPIPHELSQNTGRVLFLVGSVIATKGIVDFRRAGTTTDPVSPNKASTLVQNGIYRYTRNPMYVGFYLWLAGIAFLLVSGSALLISFLFIPYMTRFQIMPEEQALESVFGDDYRVYKTRVRRWL